LTINVNVADAQIFVNDVQQKSNVIQLPGGKAKVVVKAAGYQDFIIEVQMAGDQVLNANLAPLNFPLTVNANVKGFQVQINGADQKGNVFQLPGGTYNVTVKAPGFVDFNASVQLNGAQTVNANMMPLTYGLTVNANVAGASVTVDKLTGQAGQTFTLPGGTYQVKVSAPGYRDFNTSVQLAGNQTVAANLELITFKLSVAANVKGAQIFINGAAAGNDSVTSVLAPGSYNVSVKAPGFVDFNTTVQVNGDQKVNAVLQPMTGTLNVEAPDGAGLMVFVDGSLVKFGKIGKGEKGAMSSLVLPVGTHTVRYELGFVVAETQVTINLGQTVTVSPSFTIQVK
jgi:hypothetical protein